MMDPFPVQTSSNFKCVDQKFKIDYGCTHMHRKSEMSVVILYDIYGRKKKEETNNI